jgi:hypothetical protein
MVVLECLFVLDSWNVYVGRPNPAYKYVLNHLELI